MRHSNSSLKLPPLGQTFFSNENYFLSELIILLHDVIAVLHAKESITLITTTHTHNFFVIIFKTKSEFYSEHSILFLSQD